jgi:hypothetical protein
MHPFARKAGDALVGVINPLGLVAVRLALDAKASSRAVVQKGRHSVTLAESKPAHITKCQCEQFWAFGRRRVALQHVEVGGKTPLDHAARQASVLVEVQLEKLWSANYETDFFDAHGAQGQNTEHSAKFLRSFGDRPFAVMMEKSLQRGRGAELRNVQFLRTRHEIDGLPIGRRSEP